MLSVEPSPSQPATANGTGPEDGFALATTVTYDADEHAAKLQHWEQEYHQLSGGSFCGVVDEIWFDDIQIFREKTNQVVHETGSAWDGSRTVGVPVDMQGEGMYSGARFTRDTALTLGHGEPLDFCTPQSLDVIAISADAATFCEFGRTVWHIDIENALRAPSLLTPPASDLQQVREFLLLMMSTLTSTPRILNYAQIRKSIELEIFNNLFVLFAAAGTPITEQPTTMSRRAIVTQAKEYVAANPEEPVMVADLCRVLNVSRRTLQYAFQSVYGINPVKYLRAMRLNSVRRMIKSGEGAGASIADIAARWGFWHLSRFAADYKSLFGELPSQTLRQRAPAAPVAT